jgi:UDP-3-O-[3-hydroxymyristoyl] N-acetylglucosamine deacetylase
MLNQKQQTINFPISFSGIGVHTGKSSKVRILPAEDDTGIIFKRIDEKNKDNIIKAHYDQVKQTNLGTYIINQDKVGVSTIEHMMAAIWALKIDNLIVEIDNYEVPILDGSSEPFLFFLRSAGIKKLKKKRKYLKILKKISYFQKKNKTSPHAIIEPDDGYKIDLTIIYPNNIIGTQNAYFDAEKDSFKNLIARARTFTDAREIENMQQLGYAQGGSLKNALVVDEKNIINKDGLRTQDEFVKHKILDCIGDFYLAGSPIIGKITGYKSGHEINNKLLRKIFSDESNYCFI